ncbi:MAG: sugar transferase, partial [Candidatus Absconditabacteria bacterium]
LRLYTDLIPYIQLNVPYLNLLETMTFAVFVGLAFVFLGFLNSIYELFKPIHGYYRKFLVTWFTCVITVSFIAYFGHGFIFKYGISRFVLIFGLILSLILITLIDLIINSINSYFERKNPYRLLFIYSNESFYSKIYSNFKFYKIYNISSIKLEEVKQDLNNIIENNDIIVTLGNIDKIQLQEITDVTRIIGKDYYHISSSYFLDDLVYRAERLGPIMAIQFKPSPLDGWYRVFKRIFDILFSILFIILFSWVYVLVGLYIYIKDGLPIIYTSKRVGRSGMEFRMYKFRTMVKDAESMKADLIPQSERKGPLFKLKEDPRILSWGKFLRKASLDELPQMFNILKGEMSLVGPRPHLQEEVSKYKGWQKRLLSIKPGLTGYAQVFGRDKLDFDEEAKLDLYYIQNWSIFLDLYVIITTLKVVLKGK